MILTKEQIEEIQKYTIDTTSDDALAMMVGSLIESHEELRGEIKKFLEQ